MAQENEKTNAPDPEKEQGADKKGEGTQPKGDNSQPQSEEGKLSPLEEAKAMAEELKKQNAIMAENLKRTEKMMAENILSGRSMAGKEVSHDDKVIAEARKILKGTGYENELFPQRS